MGRAITARNLSHLLWFLGILSAILGLASASAPVLGLTVAAFAAGAVLQRPEFLLGMYLSAMYVWGLLPAALYARLSGFFLPLTAVLATLSLILHYGIKFYRLTLHDVMLLAFSGYVLLGVLWSPAPNYGIFKALSFFLGSVFLFFLMYWGYREKPQALWRFVRVVVGLGMVAFVLVLIASLNVGGFGPAARSTRVYYLQNVMGIQYFALSDALQLAAICAFALFLRSQHRLKWLWLGAFLALGWAALALSQRAQLLGIISACVGLLVFRAWLSPEPTSKRQLRVGDMVVGGLLLVVLLGIALLGASKFSISFMLQDNNILTRLELYREAVQQFLASPVWGNGTGGFTMGAFGVDARIFAHNVFLDILAEGGLIGILLWGGVLAAILSRAWKLGHTHTAASALGWIGLAVCISRFVVSLFSADLSYLNLGPWLALLSVGAWAPPSSEVFPPETQASTADAGHAPCNAPEEPLLPCQ